MNKKSETYSQGFMAYWKRLLPTDNPYKLDTQEAFDWADGYRTANYEAAN